MSANAATLIALVEGTAKSLAAEIEDAWPLPFNDSLRDAVRERIENGIGPVVAEVLELLAQAVRETRE